MKHLFLTFLLLGASLLNAQTDQISSAEKLYESGKYDSAIVIYNNTLGETGQSSTLFYNLGNCHYRNGDVVTAIWYYEKAAKLDPSNPDLKANIELVRKQFKDKVNTDRSGISGWFFTIVNGKGINYWSWLSILFINFAFLSFIVARFIAPNVGRIAMGSGFLALLGGIMFFFLARYHRSSILQHDQAIVFATKAEIKSSPSENSNTVFILTEGAKVNITGENEKWMEIAIDDANVGWIPKDQLKEI